ncbi:MAG: NYN domain-containing protein [Thermoanaerobaculales bacterium]|jgi:uncharacterized LabA/DUF88 family protein|nr:NYN domain-containing protein [Thermoanaerobaculales bacterium]
MSSRSIIYIDGFNLYYGAVRGGPHKWLDLQKYFHMLRPDDDIQRIKYFTALIDGPRRANQEACLQALDTLPKVEIILGKYKYKSVKCTVRYCTYSGPREFQVPEEKRSDVNVATHMIDDAHCGRADRMILVSGDSDLVPAIHMVKQRYPTIQITVYVPSRNPKRGAAVEIRGAADKHKTLPLNLIPRCQFPNPVQGGASGTVSKPSSW